MDVETLEMKIEPLFADPRKYVVKILEAYENMFEKKRKPEHHW